MTKVDLINEVAEATGETKKLSGEMVMAVFNTVADALSDGDSVFIKDFGKFEIKEAAARTCRNPRTGEVIEVPARNAVKFKVAKALKEAVL